MSKRVAKLSVVFSSLVMALACSHSRPLHLVQSPSATPSATAEKSAPPPTSTSPSVEGNQPLSNPRVVECTDILIRLSRWNNIAPFSDILLSSSNLQLSNTIRDLDEAVVDTTRLRSVLRTDVLVDAVKDWQMALVHLREQVAQLLANRDTINADKNALEYGVYLAKQQLSLFALSTRARCERDPSREQSDSWKQSALQIVATKIPPAIIPCAAAERQRWGGSLPASAKIEMRIHVDSSGAVFLAGPIHYNSSNPLSPTFVYCVVRVFEQLQFPNPSGVAILQVPFVPSSKPTQTAPVPTK